MEESSKLSKVVWQRIKSDLGIPVVHRMKDTNLKVIQKKIAELIDSIPFEEDEQLEAVDAELLERWSKDLKLPTLEGVQGTAVPGDTRVEGIAMLSREELTKWSDEAYELAVLLIKLGYLPHVCNEPYIRSFFRSFRFDASKITVIDEDFRAFQSLTILSLSHNRIRTLQNMPPSLVELNIYDNPINEVKGPAIPSLNHLGIGSNQLRDLSGIVQFYPNLVSLDLSYNSLSKRDIIINQLLQIQLLDFVNDIEAILYQ